MVKKDTNESRRLILTVMFAAVLSMLLTLCPLTSKVYAEGEPTSEGELQAALNDSNGGTTTLANDITITAGNAITINADTTLNIPAGRTLTISNSSYNQSGIRVNAGKTLTITGGGILDIRNGAYQTTKGIYNLGTIILTSGTVLVENTNGSGVYNEAGGSLSIAGASAVFDIKSSTDPQNKGIDNFGTINLASGTVLVENTNGSGIYNEAVGSLNIDGATAVLDVRNSGYYGIYNSGSISFSSGTVTIQNTGLYGIINKSGGCLAMNQASGATATLDVKNSGSRGIFNDNSSMTILFGMVILENYSNSAIENGNGATLSADGATIDIKTSAGYGIANYGTGSTVNLSSCTVMVENTSTYGISNSSGGTINVTGTRLDINNSGSIGMFNGNGIINLNSGIVNICNTGNIGIRNDSNGILNLNGAAVSIKNSGTYGIYNNYSGSGATITISSGTVTVESTSNYGIFNEATGVMSISQVAGPLPEVVVKSSGQCGIYNKGTLDFTSGTITVENTAGTGIQNHTTGTGFTINQAEGSTATLRIENSGSTTRGINNFAGTIALASGTLMVENTAGHGIYNDNSSALSLAGGTVVVNSSGTNGVYSSFTASISLSDTTVLWYKGTFPAVTPAGTGVFYYGTVLDIAAGGTSLTPGSVTTGGTSHSWFANEPVSGMYAVKKDDVIAVNGGSLVVDNVDYSSGITPRTVDSPGGTLHYQAPGLSAGTATRANSASGSVQFSSTQVGDYYYQIDGTAPADAVALIASAAGTQTGASLGTNTINLTSLSPGAHTVYIACKDANSIAGNMLTVTVPLPPATHFMLNTPATATVKEAFDVTVTALDDIGNVAAGYDGTVRFTASDTAAVLPTDYTFKAADNGTHTFTGGAELKTAGSQTITANDTVTSITGTSGPITVNKYSPSLTLSADLSSPQVYPQSIILTATLFGADNDAGKTVAFSVYGKTNTEITNPDGIAIYTFDSPAPNTYTFGAAYVGDNYNNPATAADITGYSINKGTQTGFAFVDENPADMDYSPAFSYTNPTSGGQSTGAVTYAITGGTGNATINPTTGEIAGVTAAGTIIVTAIKAADSNYSQASATYTLTVVKDDQTGFAFAVANPADIDYSPTFSYTNAANGGPGTGAVTYAITGGTGSAAINPATGEITNVTVSGTIIVKATKAEDSNYKQAAAVYTLTVLKIDPVVTFPSGATISSGQPLSAAVFSGQNGAGVYAYKSGTIVPTVSGTQYEVTFTPTDIGNYNILSQNVRITINPNGTVATPAASPAGGAYAAAQTVTLSTATAGAAIYYTTDGSTPTTAGTQYSTPVHVPLGTTLKAIAVKAGMVDSAVMTEIYQYNGGGSSGSSGDRSRDSGRSSTPSAPVAPTPAYKAYVSKTGISATTLPITVNTGTNSATVDVSTQQGNIFNSQGTTVITVPPIPGVNRYTLGIPADYLSGTKGEGMLTFSSGSGSISLTAYMLAGVAGAEGKKAEITIGQGDKAGLPEAVKAAIGDKPLIQLSVRIDGRQTEWNNPNAPVTISIPYTPAAAELANPESIIIWYIDGSGKAVSIPNGNYDPATGTVTFATTHFSCYAVGYNKVSFKDIPASAWYNRAVGFIAARGITAGTGNGNFNPHAKLTRGEFLVMLMRAYGMTPDASLKDNFADAGNTYYTGYLAEAKKLGLTSGVGSNLYAPDKEITRQEMFTLLYNTLKATGRLPQGNSGKQLPSFSDAGQVAAWAKDAMELMIETGIINGSGGKLAPASTTTRSEMSQVLYNLLAK